tara:strand:- start:228 stop:452 length:225 start_codon:yes stop_codon:yes gene_type:complete
VLKIILISDAKLKNNIILYMPSYKKPRTKKLKKPKLSKRNKTKRNKTKHKKRGGFIKGGTLQYFITCLRKLVND